MTTSEQFRENPRAVLAANFKRIAEALRSLEEYSKLVDVWLAGRFEVLRYDVYTIEKLTMTAVAAHRSLGDARLMVLIGGLPTLGDLTWIAEEAIAGGADVDPVPRKGHPRSRAAPPGPRAADRDGPRPRADDHERSPRPRPPGRLRRRPPRAGGRDDPRRAADPGRGGPDRRLDPRSRAARRRRALAAPATWASGRSSPARPRSSPSPSWPGCRSSGWPPRPTALPWFAIGGINAENVDRVLEAGASRVAVSGAVVRAESPRRAAARLKARLNGLDPDAEPDTALQEE